MPVLLLLGAASPALALNFSGTYTVPSTQFPTLNDVQTQLNAGTVTGPTVFNITAGTYTGANWQCSLGSGFNGIAGLSATNTITFQSTGGTVTLSPAGSSPSNNYVFRMVNVNYITIKDLTLNNTGATYGADIDFQGNASNNTVNNCILTGNTSTSTSQYKARVYGYYATNTPGNVGLTGTNNTISNCTIVNGSHAFFLYGSNDPTNGFPRPTGWNITGNTITTPYYSTVYGYYMDGLNVANNSITVGSVSSFNGIYMYDCDGAVKVTGNSQIVASTTSTYYALYQYYCDGTPTTKQLIANNTFTNSSSSSTAYVYYSWYNNYDSLVGNTFNGNYYSTTYGTYMYYNNYMSLKSNILTLNSNSSNTMYLCYNYGSGYGMNHIWDGNTLTAYTTSSGTFYNYQYYQTNQKFINNTINMTSNGGSCLNYNYYGTNYLWSKNTFNLKTTSSGTVYGIYDYSTTTYPKGEVSYNKINAESGSGTCYGLVEYYHIDVVKIHDNAVWAKSPSSGSCNALYLYYMYSPGQYQIYNNTFHSVSSSTTYGSYMYLGTNTGTQSTFYNNIVSKEGSTGNYALYYGTNGYMTYDYNMYWNGGGSINSSYATITAMRAGTGMEKNSVNFPPAYTNSTLGDLSPDPSNSNCWAMNGRGIHIAGNATDVNGNPHALVPGTGVPDLGAYEFTPNAGVLAPTCNVTPAAPAPGNTQVYTLGEDTVATIKWDPAATVPPTAPVVRNYSGAMAPGFTAVNNTAMYFYTDIQSGTNANYTANIYYKDPQIGTIGSEALLHLAKKDGTNPWVIYPFGVSGANTSRNFIFTPTSGPLNTYGLYTGADLANNAATDSIIAPTGTFCPGTYPVVVRIKNMGNNVLNSVKVEWSLDAVYQGSFNITQPINYNNGTYGSNFYNLALGNVTFGSTARVIKVWTSLPNGTTDPYVLDDTITVNKRSALAGVYTVGGTAPDFNTPRDMVDALNNVGICGAVTFNIRPGTYNTTTALILNNVAGTSPTTRVTIQSENGNASSVNIVYAAVSSGSNDNTLNLNSASYISVKNISLTGSGTYQYVLGGTNMINDSIKGCIINTTLSSTITYPIYIGSPGSSTNCVFQNNTINGGYYGMYWYASSSALSAGLVIDNNTFNSVYYMGMYIFYTQGVRITNNTITQNASYTYGYGTYIYYSYPNATLNQAPVVSGNKILNFNGYGGMLVAYFNYNGGTGARPRAEFSNNVIVFGNSSNSSNNYGLYLVIPCYADIYHNTVVDNATNSYYTLYMDDEGGTYGSDNKVINNIFWTADPTATSHNTIYWYHITGNNDVWDYNNVYGPNTSAMIQMSGTVGSGFGSLNAWRTNSTFASYGYGANSISYPAGVSKTNGIPDPTSASSWSINGRGLQNTFKPLDILGNARPTTLAAGVPDIGAYEFEPSVAPPAALVTPALPAPGVSQTFTFGGNEVAVIKWNTQLALTANLTVKQYSGRVPPSNFAGMTGGKQMYFYTDITPSGSGTTFDFNVSKLDYYHTWLGTTNAASSVTAEKLMKLAEKVPTYPTWIAYNNANSQTLLNSGSAVPNGGYILGPGITSFGAFTGIDSGLVFSALVRVLGSSVLCQGNSVTLAADPTSGGSTTYTYQWLRNGSIISGATSSTYAVTLGGDYSVTITGVGAQSSTSVPVTITVVPPPMALISATGALTYCTGSNLNLNASGGGTNYQWQLNGVDIPGATSQNYKVNSSGSYTVKVSNVGCAVASSATIVNAGPINVNLGTDINACELKNQGYILDAGYPGAKYLWSTGDTTQTITVNSGSGTYTVTVDAGPNCKGKDDVLVNLSPLPKASGISYQRAGDKFVFNAAGASNVDQYLWLFSDGTNYSGPTVEKDVAGNLMVKLVISNNCGSDTINMIEWATGVPKVTNGNLDISVYPNPAKDKVSITVTGAYMKDVTVMNSIGEVVYRTEMGGTATTLDVNVGGFASGRYIIRANTTEGIISKPFNVQQRQ